MRLGSLLRSEPFRAALRMVLVFTVLYSAVSFVLIRSVENTFRADLARLAEVEGDLLREIYARQGEAGLARAIESMGQQGRVADRTYGLFNAQNLKLAGDIPARPDFIGIGRRPVEVVRAGAVNGRFVLFVDRINTLTLVVGRDDTLVQNAVLRLLAYTVGFGVLLVFSILALGLWASRSAQMRLDKIDAGLRSFAEGDLSQRLPIGSSNDQIDRVSVRMNANLSKLERLMGGMKSTASAIAHDLKTPLSHAQIAMHDAARALADGKDPSPEIGRALEETDKLNTLFETVLRLSRIQSTHLNIEEVDLSEIAKKATEFLGPVAEENGQTISVSPGFEIVHADRSMLEQALVNLIQNACVHAGQGAQIDVLIAQTKDGASIEVQDNGPGIPEDELDTVRDPFQRGTAARDIPGHGLGLAIVQAIADVHQAEFSLYARQPGLAARMFFPSLKNS
ncbi:MAG: HAMP domain-containing sensor histidine kinase [Pseudomonadota bacterium]